MEQSPLCSNIALDEYNIICSVLDDLPFPSVCYNRENHLRYLYPNIPLDTIASIIQYHYQQKVKKCHFALRNKGDTIYYRFLKGLQRQQPTVAFNLALEFRQPPYLVSQILLQKHFAKQWEDEKTKEKSATGEGKTTTESKKKNHETKDSAQNSIKRITPVLVNSAQEFPSLRETSVKQKRVTPTAVRSASEPSNSSAIQFDTKRLSARSSPTTLALSDVMVVKTKRSKKNSQSGKVRDASGTHDRALNEARSRVMVDLMQDRDKNKLFDRILNKGKPKEADAMATVRTESDIRNNNVVDSHLTPKKVKFVGKQRISDRTECDQSGSTAKRTETSADKPVCPAVDSVTRVTPQRLDEQPASSHEHTLSSIHFMTQDCQNKEALYEDYRYKLQRLSERFTRQLQPERAAAVRGESKEKIEKLTERMRGRPLTRRVYLSALDETERTKAEAALLTKLEREAKRDDKPKETLMTPQDLDEWKRILWNSHRQPEVMVEQATAFWQKFSAKAKTVNGPKDFLKRMLRDPSIISDPILSKEIAYNNAMDDQYGPVADLYNRSLGILYEDKLTDYLTESGVAFKSEKVCMTLGFDKTPDVLLDPALYIGGAPVNWIESKAVFGNPHNHEQYHRNQYRPYCERFGPGCVIYWFGHVDSIEPARDQFIILTDVPPRSLMQQPAVPDSSDLAAFLSRCSSVIQVEVEIDPQKEPSPSQPKSSFGSPRKNPSQLNSNFGSPRKNPSQLNPNFGSPRKNPSQLNSNFGSPRKNPSQLNPNFGSPGKNPIQKKSSFVSPRNNPSQTNLMKNKKNPKRSEILTNPLHQSASQTNPLHQSATQTNPSFVSPCTSLSNHFNSRVKCSESPRPKCLFKSFSDMSDGVACSTPVKQSQSSSRHSSPPTSNTSAGDLSSSEFTPSKRLDAGERRSSVSPRTETDRLVDTPLQSDSSCEIPSPARTDTWERDVTSPEASFAHAPAHGSSLDCSAVSQCSMCDISLAKTGNCSLCAKSPSCFSSRCSDKLLSYTTPCSCECERSPSCDTHHR